MTRSKGFTLIELMVTMIVLAILVAVGLPAFTTMINSNQLVAQTNQTTSHIAFARSEAAKRPGWAVTLCASSDGAACSNSANWENGWIIFSDANRNRVVDSEDTNGNGALDPGEDLDNDGVIDTDQILLVAPSLGGSSTLRTTGFANSSFVQFFDDGMPSSAGTFVLCDSRGVSRASGVVISISGQTRLAVDENSDGIVNTHAGAATNVSCP